MMLVVEESRIQRIVVAEVVDVGLCLQSSSIHSLASAEHHHFSSWLKQRLCSKTRKKKTWRRLIFSLVARTGGKGLGQKRKNSIELKLNWNWIELGGGGGKFCFSFLWKGGPKPGERLSLDVLRSNCFYLVFSSSLFLSHARSTQFLSSFFSFVFPNWIMDWVRESEMKTPSSCGEAERQGDTRVTFCVANTPTDTLTHTEKMQGLERAKNLRLYKTQFIKW